MILDNMHRHPISDEVLKGMILACRLLGSHIVPSLDAIKKVRKRLQAASQVEVKGVLGNLYYANSLSDVVRQDFANPDIRRHLQLYPRRGFGLSTILDGAWRDDRDRLRAPMVVLPGRQHVYLREPIVLKDGKLVLTTMWLQEPIGVVGDGFELDVAPGIPGCYQINNTKPICYAINDIDRFSSSLTDAVLTVLDAKGDSIPLSNPYRQLAAGRPLYVIYIQRAGDDMSGTTSKRWNEHLACYFAYASLPAKERNRECNIRFLTISMTAKELELDVSTVHMIL